MEAFGRYCVAALVLTVICQRVKCSPLNTVISEEVSPCFHDCSIKGEFCENGGTCIKLSPICSATSYACLCPSGFIGSRCHIVDEPCKYDQLLRDVNCHCENGAICRKIGEECAASSYTCDCNAGYEGVLCENPIPIDFIELITTAMSAEPSTTSTTHPIRLPSAAEGVNVQRSVGTFSTEEVSNGNPSSPATALLVLNSTVSPRKFPPTAENTIPAQTTKQSRQWTPELKSILDIMKRMKLYPQTYPQFCSNCIHGQCSENETGGKCVCNLGYYGRNCDSQCSKECLHGGICVYSLGSEFCQCHGLYEGEFCATKIAAPTNIPTPLDTTRTPQLVTRTKKNIYQERYGERFCAANFECIHGVCNGADYRHPSCLCQEGFIGDFCHIKCVKKCLNGGQCLIVKGTEKCNCPHGYRGQLCETNTGYVPHPLSTKDPLKQLNSNAPVSRSKHSTKDPKQFLLELFMRQYKSSRRTESRDPKQCAANFVCIHGNCDKSVPGHFRCKCDEGYIGFLCQQQCSLKCGNHGACVVLHGQQYCTCKYGFGGKGCERSVYHDIVREKIIKTTAKGTSTGTTLMK